MLRSQFGVPGKEGTVFYETVRTGLLSGDPVHIAGSSISPPGGSYHLLGFNSHPAGRVGIQPSVMMKEIGG